jgi:hypothetical protein
MKKLIAISSALAIFMASSGLFAFDILNGDGEASGFSVSATIQYGFDITTQSNEVNATTANGSSWVNEIDSDPQSKVNLGVSYDGDAYAFGVGAGWSQARASVDPTAAGVFLDDAWGKFYLFNKQFSIRAGSLAGLWHHGTDPDDGNWADGDKGLQFNVAPTAVPGLNVGFTLPVPGPGARTWTETDKKGNSEAHTGDWSPSYLIQNAVFGLKLDNTLPNFVFGSELHLKGVDAATEKDSLGFDTRVGIQYTLKPVTLKAVVKIEDFGAAGPAVAGDSTLDPLVTELGARLIFALPDAGNFVLGSPWVQVVGVPQETGKDGDIGRPDREAFTQTNILFGWEPSFKLIPDKLTAIFYTELKYSIYDNPTTAQEDYPMYFYVRPGIKFSFSPNASLQIRDAIYFAQEGIEDGLKNVLQFRCSLNF